MSEYVLNLQEVDDFIPALSEQWAIGYKQELGEYILSIPRDLGTGKINCINFPNGIGLYWINCNFKERTKLEIVHRTVTPFRMIYCLEGKLESIFDNDSNHTTIFDHEHLIAAPRADESHSLIFQSDMESNICYIEIDRLKFKQYLSFDLNEIDPVYYKLFSDIQATNRVSNIGRYGLEIYDVIREIENCKMDGFPRINFMGAKSLEILSIMLTKFSSDFDKINNVELKKKDITAIEKAVSYINDNLSSIKSLDIISKEAGVNINKLQIGFNAVYGKTINVYIRDVRLTKALNLLSSGQKNVSEVVYELGLSSRSYFSKIFKKKYGISPSKILANSTLNYEVNESDQ